MTLLDRIKELAIQQGTNPSKIEKEIGLSRGAIYQWKTSTPSADTLAQVARILQTTTDYLLTGESSQNDKSPDPKVEGIDEEIIRLYSQLSPEKRARVRERAKILLEEDL